jgi:hypothetical protein
VSYEPGGMVMIIARWNIDTRFGYKPIVIDFIKKWHRDISVQRG